MGFICKAWIAGIKTRSLFIRFIAVVPLEELCQMDIKVKSGRIDVALPMTMNSRRRTTWYPPNRLL